MLGLLCLLVTILLHGCEGRTSHVNPLTPACPNGVVYREGCKFCYCIEEEGEAGFVRRKCDSKYTSDKKCKAVGRRAHCRPHRLLYDYRSECEGRCWCNKARNLTTCENLPCDNALLSLLGYYDQQSDETVGSNSSRNVKTPQQTRHYKRSPKIVFHSRRIRRDEQEEGENISITGVDDLVTATITNTNTESDIDEDTWEFDDPQSSPGVGSTETKTTTLPTLTTQTIVEEDTSEIIDGTENVDTELPSPIPVTPSRPNSLGMDDRNQRSRKTPGDQQATRPVPGDEEDTDYSYDEDCETFESYTYVDDVTDTEEDREDYEDGTDAHTKEPPRGPENMVSAQCPWGVYHRIGCRVCYCLTDDDQGSTKTICSQDFDYEVCRDLAPKAHCDERNLLYDYDPDCEGSCKCERRDSNQEIVTTCERLPCNDRMLRQHGYYQ